LKLIRGLIIPRPSAASPNRSTSARILTCLSTGNVIYVGAKFLEPFSSSPIPGATPSPPAPAATLTTAPPLNPNPWRHRPRNISNLRYVYYVILCVWVWSVNAENSRRVMIISGRRVRANFNTTTTRRWRQRANGVHNSNIVYNIIIFLCQRFVNEYENLTRRRLKFEYENLRRFLFRSFFHIIILFYRILSKFCIVWCPIILIMSL